jgi:hypothetical protein
VGNFSKSNAPATAAAVKEEAGWEEGWEGEMVEAVNVVAKVVETVKVVAKVVAKLMEVVRD